MPKMTRSRFVEATEAVWRQAEADYVRHGFVASRMVGFDAMARMTDLLQVPDARTADAVLAARDVVPVAGEWAECVPQVRDVFVEKRVVAALLITEAWVASNEYGLDTLRMGLAPSEHPMSDEAVVVAGRWPREHVAATGITRIVRDERGQNPRLGAAEFVASGSVLFGWLDAVLPPPY